MGAEPAGQPRSRQQQRVAYAAGMTFVVVYYDDDNFEALQARVAGKDKSRANTGAGQKTSWIDITDVHFSFTLLFSQLVALIRFVEYVIAANPWNYVSAVFCGIFVMSQLYPMVKKRVPESSGWDHTAATFTANAFGSFARGLQCGLRAAMASLLRGQSPGGPMHRSRHE